MSLIEDNDTVFGEFSGDSFGNLRVEEVVVGINDNVAERHLERKTETVRDTDKSKNRMMDKLTMRRAEK